MSVVTGTHGYRHRYTRLSSRVRTFIVAGTHVDRHQHARNHTTRTCKTNMKIMLWRLASELPFLCLEALTGQPDRTGPSLTPLHQQKGLGLITLARIVFVEAARPRLQPPPLFCFLCRGCPPFTSRAGQCGAVLYRRSELGRYGGADQADVRASGRGTGRFCECAPSIAVPLHCSAPEA